MDETIKHPGKTLALFTEEERATGNANGISIQLMRRRLYRGWDRQDIYTIPPARKRPRGTWVELARAHGISTNSYYQRVHRGMTPEEAATTPKMRSGRQAKPKKQKPLAKKKAPKPVKPSKQDNSLQAHIKAEEGTASLEAVAEKHNVEPSFVKDVWTYYC